MASQPAEIVEQPFPLAYILVGAMSVIAAWLASLIAGELVTTWRAGAYLLGAAVAIGSAVLLREAIAREQPGATVLAALRVRELLIVVGGSAVASLILRYVPWDPLGLIDMLLNIWFDPQSYIDGRDIVTFLLLIGAWAFPIRPLEFLERLVVKQKDLPPPRPINRYDDLTAVRLGLPDLTLVHRKLAGWVMTSLLVLALLLGYMWQGLGPITHAFAAVAIVGYAALGFTLLAVGNFELRRSRWLIEGITPEGETADRWAAAGSVLAGGLAILAALIPAIALLALVRIVIGGLLYIFYRLMQLGGVITPPPGSYRQPVLPQLPFVPPPAKPPPVTHGGNFPDWLIPVVVAFAALVVGLAVIYLASRLRKAGRGPRLTWLRSLAGLLNFLAGLGLSLRRWLASLRGLAAALAERLQRAPRDLAARVSRNSGPPSGSGAAVVRYWYGQMIRQGNRSGLPRRPGQTPHEYRAAVRSQVMEADEALHSLTEAYVAARYSRQEIGPDRGAEAQRQFRQVRQAMLGWLRRLRRGERSSGAPPS
ncbi:MAG TPA: DUF4129 domain-containing protein [Chloroflexota bacterium]|nr:DUF4129 domain-containing protein [Chloroflexota bacterium]